MIVVLALFGHEIVRVEIGTPASPDDDEPEQTISSRHGGDFSFGFSPAGPYWTHDPDAAPPVA